ncbi:MAG: sulfatase [Planctomycetaceae bacterium]|jgi:arylsulfatase A-like enzyme|nr:sulfatase [Planctomycetaceae bacterium]
MIFVTKFLADSLNMCSRLLAGLILLTSSVLFAAERPNIVFFLVDDLGVMDIGANNPNTFYETPNVDRLAKEGVRFTNGYAACSVCSPTRFSIMTGKYPARGACTNWFGANDAARFRGAEYNDRMPLNEITLAEAFKEAGYKTIYVGKWHLGPTEEFWPKNQGFDVNIGGWSRGNPGQGGYFSPYNNPKLPDGPDGEYLTDRLAKEAVQQIREAKDSPFLLYFAFYQVHTPLLAPEPLIEKYRAKAERLHLPTGGKEILAASGEQNANGKPIQIRKIQSHPVYAAMVESMDTAVGKVIDSLREEKLLDNTIICFVSDNGGQVNGPTSNLPIRAGKSWLYEGGHRVPYIIRLPHGKGSVSDVPVITNDFYPTLLDLAGLPLKPKQHLDGISLKPILEGGAAPKRDALYWHYPHYGAFPGGVIRKDDWKLIRRYEDGRTELYHLKDDPFEENDLADKEPERVKQLAEEHNQWLQSVGARFLREKNGSEPWLPPYKNETIKK